MGIGIVRSRLSRTIMKNFAECRAGGRGNLKSIRTERQHAKRTEKNPLKKRLLHLSIPGMTPTNSSPITLNTSAALLIDK